MFNWFFHFLLIVGAVLFTELEAKVKIGIISKSNYCGEREVGWRIKAAAKQLGWKAVLDETGGYKLMSKKLDWVICLLPDNKCLNKDCPNYLTIFHPFNYLDDNRNLKPFYERYDGFLCTIKNTENMQSSLEMKNKKYRAIQFYPSVYAIPYRRVKLNHLMTMIPVWSNRLYDTKFQEVYYKLSLTGFTKFYGINANPTIIAKGYKGNIPFDGYSVIEVLQKCGIVLIFHSDIHNEEGIPSSRIFEASAASTVIISDENPFVKKHFGDSVFYVDTSQSSEEIFQQIKSHMETIRSNPEMALGMAKKAHEIFIEQFELKNQLLKLQVMHNDIKKGLQQALN